jgi:tetratricopeptide (TPR) repeat protein
VSAALLLAGITAAAIALARRRPYLLVGWLWFVGTLVPVIGLVQVGGQAKADRYSYVPLIGIFVMAAWSAGGAAALAPLRRRARAVAAVAVLAGLAAVTSRQLGFWRDGASLFRHAVAVTENNWVAHANLSAALAKSSSPGAAAEYQETLRILASFADTYVRKGIELEKTPGRLPEAIRDFRTAVRILPVLAAAHFRLGTALARTPGGLPEAIEELRKATSLEPGQVEAHFNLGAALAGSPGGQAEAVAEFETVVKLAPGDFLAHFYLGQILSRMPGRRDEAVAQFESALAARPDFRQAREMIERLRASPQ